MNLLYFSFEFPPFFAGGLGTYSFEMSRRFARMGDSVSVFAKNPGDALTSDLFEGVEIHRPLLVDAMGLLPAIVPGDVQQWPLSSQNYFAEVLTYNILSASKAANLLVKTNRRRFDLVVAHDWLSVMAGIICKRALEKPLVFHIHSTEEGRTTDGSLTIKNLEKLGGQVADLIITVSYTMRDHLMSIGYDEKKIRVVHNGVDEKKYDITRFSEGEISTFREELGVGGDPMLFFIGRLTWVKGADTLVRAMPMILREVPDAKLVILGSGDQEGLIRNLVSQLGIEDSVKLHFKYVDEAKRILYYAASDIAIFPSKYEPFGIVGIEAMSMGKPIIVGAKGISGLREQVIPSGPNRCGSHIDPDDPSDIAKFAIELLKNASLREKYGRNARKRVLSSFTLDRIAEETIKVYKEAIETRPP